MINSFHVDTNNFCVRFSLLHFKDIIITHNLGTALNDLIFSSIYNNDIRFMCIDFFLNSSYHTVSTAKLFLKIYPVFCM